MRATIALLQVLGMLLALGVFCTAMNSVVERERVVTQSPPYYECNGPKATRHPRCDRD